MNKIENKITVHVNIDYNVVKNFDKAFPACRRRFVQNAMKLALESKETFDRIFFCDLIPK